MVLKNSNSKKTLIVIVGPTAIGKTSLSIDVAQHFNTEILSADSRQFYKELKIGAAPPSLEELNTIKHHFIGNLTLKDYYNVSIYEQEALKTLETLFNKENIALGNDSFAYTEYSNAEKSFGYKIFLTNLNGKNKEEIANESLDPFNIIINQKTLYYIIDRSNIFEIYSIDLKNNNKNLIAELNQKPEYFSIHNNIIYFLTENKLYSYAVETKIITEIFIDKIESYYLFNQYIFYTKDGKIFSKLDKENFEIIAGKTLIKVE